METLVANSCVPYMQGGKFYLMYGVIHRGALEFYKSQEAYDTGAKSIKKVQLRNLNLSTKPQDFHQDATGFISVCMHISHTSHGLSQTALYLFAYYMCHLTSAPIFLGLQARPQASLRCRAPRRPRGGGIGGPRGDAGRGRRVEDVSVYIDCYY